MINQKKRKRFYYSAFSYKRYGAGKPNSFKEDSAMDYFESKLNFSTTINPYTIEHSDQ